MHDELSVRQLLDRARSGDAEALGVLLESYRNYVRLLASQQVYRRMQSKLAASDLVQETFLHAKQGFDGFRGETEAELLAWLRRILANRLSSWMRRLVTHRRNVNLEQHLQAELDQSSEALGQQLVADDASPSEHFQRREQAVLLAEALERLKPEYRDVISLRHLHGEPFSEVANKMGRSVHSVKNLWARAVSQLRDELQDLR